MRSTPGWSGGDENGAPQSNEASPGGGQHVTSFVYRLGCGVCKDECREHFSGSTEQEMGKALVAHYNDLWEVLQASEDKEWDENLPFSMIITTGGDQEFAHSSFGGHLIRHHLRRASSRKEVREWCMKNVDVKVKLHKYEKRPDTHAFDFKETKKKALFVENQEKREEEWEEKKRKEEEEHKERLAQANALRKDGGCFDDLWMQRYEELEKYAAEHGGDTNVPLDYRPSPMLGRWVGNQRKQFRRKHNVRPRVDEGSREVFTDEKEVMLKALGFRWFDVPMQRWSERGIAVMYGYEEKEDC